MSEIVLTEEQAKIITAGSEQVILRDANGQLLGYVARSFTRKEIEEAERDLESDQPRYTTKEVLDRLRSLEQE